MRGSGLGFRWVLEFGGIRGFCGFSEFMLLALGVFMGFGGLGAVACRALRLAGL